MNKKTERVGEFCQELVKKGQPLYEFLACYLIIIKEFYHSAGYRFWKKEVKRGLSSEGFSLNDRIYNSIPLEDLIIFEKKNSEFFKLSDKQKLRKLKGINYRNGVKLHVLPLSAYSTVQVLDIENIINSPVGLSKISLTTTQQKLEVVS